MQWYVLAFKKYAVFDGRSRRKEYWFFCLFNLLASVALAMVDSFTGMFNAETGVGLLGALYSLAVIVPGIAVTMRRLHDTGRSGWWILLVLMPLIGVLALIFLLVLASDEGGNEYGASPIVDEIELLP